MVAASLANQPVICTLCGLSTSYPLHDAAGQSFCCPACREVSALLASDANGQEEAVVTASEDGAATTTLCLGGLWCTSCGWLIGATLQRSVGVQAAEVSF